MEGMAELEELDGDKALIFYPSVLSLDNVAESPESAVARVVSGKRKQQKTGKKKVNDSSRDSVLSACTVKSASRTAGHGREPVKASEEAADPASSHKSKSRKSVRSSSSDTRKNSTASDRSSAPAGALCQSNASPTACGDAASASPASQMPPRCTLDDATEQWQFVQELRTALPAWLSALDSSSEDLLHPAVLRALQDCRFFAPTPIQRAVLLAALRDRKDIVGAAETGSGKTLAYGVPIVCNLLAQALRRNEKEIEHKNKTKALKKKRKMRVEGGGESLGASNLSAKAEAAGDRWPNSSDDELEPEEEASDSGEANSEAGTGAGNTTGGPKSVGGKVDGPECLIVVPSRELALQVQRHLETLCVYTPLAAVCLVGGLALQKQLRLLGQVRPQIVIGTPGRLFAVIQDAQASVSRSLALGGEGILDHESVSSEEANRAGHSDRGTQNGEEGNRRGRIERGQEFMASLHTLRFLVLDEADRLTQEGCFQEMEGLLDAIYKAQASPKKAKNAGTKRRRGSSREDDENAFALGECRKIQTFIFSATLAMDPSSRQKKKHRRDAKDRQSVLQALMDRVHLRKKRLAVVDLSIEDGDTTKLKQSLSHEDDPDWKFGKAGHPPGPHNHAAGPLKLPDGLSITALKTAAGEEELYLVLFLLKLFVSAPANEPLKVMIFVNAISYVYRLDPILSLVLGRDKHQACQRGGSKGAPLAEVVGLHSNLQQKQRLKRVERFQSANRAVIVCTDVACRGLDLKQVKEVIHFQAPRSPSIFVHRSGRTARAQQSGETVCVLSPNQVIDWLQVLRPVQINVGELDPPACMHKSSRVYSQLTKVKRILTIATQIESAGHHKAKERRATSWLKKAAQAADIMLDSDISEDEEASARSAAQARTTSILRTELSQLVKSLKLL
ncbi:UNVERIFIED_CONTAM: DEAD/DEAH box helicase domain-containing protein [Hammondia hammondi]|eukprot:XP_008882429.1 DEAD/DEAH box helicase domain-containing protein [Hammondia hammondi]